MSLDESKLISAGGDCSAIVQAEVRPANWCVKPVFCFLVQAADDVEGARPLTASSTTPAPSEQQFVASDLIFIRFHPASIQEEEQIMKMSPYLSVWKIFPFSHLSGQNR